MLVALILVGLAAGVFFIDFARSAWTTLTSLGLGLFAAGVAIDFYVFLDHGWPAHP